MTRWLVTTLLCLSATLSVAWTWMQPYQPVSAVSCISFVPPT